MHVMAYTICFKASQANSLVPRVDIWQFCIAVFAGASLLQIWRALAIWKYPHVEHLSLMVTDLPALATRALV